jgi:hypothetical protein
MLLTRLIAAAVMLLTLLASTLARADVSATVGADLWDSQGGPARYLPDYAPAKPWQPAAAWATLSARTKLGPITLTASGQTHQVNGWRVDRLDADWRVTDGMGLRLGVLPYRVTWCRSLGDGPWMLEPDAYCRFHGLREVGEGAFGVQAYATGLHSGWLLDGMVGVYRPQIDNQDDKLGPYVSVGPTVRHVKHGASLNAVHLSTGLQLRAAWLRTAQDQDSDAGGYQRRMRYDMTYLAAELPATRWLTLRASRNTNAGDQINPASPFQWHGTSTTLESIARPGPADAVALGLSEYDNRTTYPRPPNGQRVTVPSVSLAWRHQRRDWSLTAQATRTIDTGTSRAGVQANRAGNAYGVRLARVF